MNKAILIGRLTKDPELKTTTTGKHVCNFSLAVNDTRASNRVTFLNCSAWDKTAEFIGNYLKKGSLISVDGRITTRSYVAKDGRNVNVTEIVADSVHSVGSKPADGQGDQMTDLDSVFESPKTVDVSGAFDKPKQYQSKPKHSQTEEFSFAKDGKDEMDWLDNMDK